MGFFLWCPKCYPCKLRIIERVTDASNEDIVWTKGCSVIIHQGGSEEEANLPPKEEKIFNKKASVDEHDIQGRTLWSSQCIRVIDDKELELYLREVKVGKAKNLPSSHPSSYGWNSYSLVLLFIKIRNRDQEADEGKEKELILRILNLVCLCGVHTDVKQVDKQSFSEVQDRGRPRQVELGVISVQSRTEMEKKGICRRLSEFALWATFWLTGVCRSLKPAPSPSSGVLALSEYVVIRHCLHW
ncbi:hypothetical protein GH733_002185, partial [Mirounga leonina]